MPSNLRYIEKDSNIVNLELPVIAYSFEIEKIKLKEISYEAALLLNFFINNPFYRCNFDEILKINKVGEEDKSILKDEMRELLSYKKLFNNSSFYNDLQEMSIGLSPLGVKLFEEGYLLTNEIETEKYTFYYDIATRRFLNEEENKTVLANEDSFFHNKNYRFLCNYLQEDNSFLKDKNFSAELPIPMQVSDLFSVSEQKKAVTSKITNGFYYSKQKLTKKKLTSRLIKNGLSIIQKYNKTSYLLDKKYEEIFANYSEEFAAAIREKQNKKNSSGFNFGSANTFKYLSWTAEELEHILMIHTCTLFLPKGLKTPIPYNEKNKIIWTSNKLFSPNSEFEFFLYALDHMYTITRSFYNTPDFKEFMGNKISKEKFFQAFKFYLDTPINPLFHELLPIIEETNSLDLFINSINKSKKIALQKLLDANQFFKNNPEWSSFFKRYMLDIIFKEIMRESYKKLNTLLALHRFVGITPQEFLELVKKSEYILPIELQGFSLSELERKCLWYDELYHHNFLRETIKRYIHGIAPIIKERNAFSKETLTLLSEEFNDIINNA